MIKIYFDWNVMSQMKNGRHCELKEIVFDNDNFFKPYSTSHISDILSSFKDNEEQSRLINEDLAFISEMTNDTFIFNDGKDIIVDFAAPKEYYNQKVDEKDKFEDISIDGLLKHFEDNELTRDLIKPLFDLLKEISLDDVFKEAFDNPQSSKQMEMLFPGLKDNPTMGGFFKSFSEMRKGLNQDDKYNDLRNIVQSGLGINRDIIIDNKAPYEIIKNKYKQFGMDNKPYTPDDKNAPKWFNEITNEYILLDMHGYQEDKVNILKGRKETFKNTTEDAFHAAFASTCNFYVINDKKACKKTKEVYKKLQINTLVCKPDEFVEYFKKYLDIKQKIWNVNLVFEIIENSKFVEEQLENGVLRTYYFSYFILEFISIRNIILTCEIIWLMNRLN